MFHPHIDQAQYSALLYASTGLLGSTTIDKFAKKKSNGTGEDVKNA